MNNQFSENLKKIRKDHNLSQEQLADSLGVSRQAISKWESGIAYPEMDKIIALCDMFHLNIDDLLHKDVKELKGEEESKKTVNHYVDDFLKFITDTVNMFSSMTFKSKVKCIFEQCLIAFVLYLASSALTGILNSLSFRLIDLLPAFVSHSLYNSLSAVLSIFCFVASIVIMVHLFKTRYLDYYTKTKEEVKSEEKVEEEKPSKVDKKEKKETVDFKKNEDKIIIRDPDHSEYRFINGLFKIIVAFIKFFAACIALSVCFTLVFIFASFVLCFLVYKTGFFFLGCLLTVLSSGIATAIILAILLNFIFNRKGNKKIMIWGFILSVIVFGIGCGCIFKGSLNFDLVEYDGSMNKTITVEHDMTDGMYIYTHDYDEIDYIEEDIPNIKIDYSISKYCDVEDQFNPDTASVNSWVSCQHPMQLIRETLKMVNDKKIIYFNQQDKMISVHASAENIAQLKANWERVLEERSAAEAERHSYENQIDELTEENDNLREQVAELNASLEECKLEQ